MHEITNWTVTKKPSCSEKGEQEGVCVTCNQTFSEEIEKLEHVDDNKWVIVTAASENKAGEKATYCKVCGTKLQSEKYELTLEEKNALKSARSYLSFMAFSRKGLIDQLEYEGFSTDAATLAVDSLNADWNEQAAKCAQSYLDVMSFSKSGLISQLKYEGFTAEQAEYGASAVGY